MEPDGGEFIRKDPEEFIQQYADAAVKALSSAQERHQLEMMARGIPMGEPPMQVTRSMLIRMWCQRYLLFWFEILTWPTLALICVRLWMR